MSNPDSLPPPRVLIVDDDHTARLLEREALEQSGFAVVEACDGNEALAAVDRQPPDLMLLDVDMPGLDGFAVCRQIRQRWAACDIPIIMVTGMDDLASINLAYEVGANDFMAKPINWPILGHRARYVLRAAESVRIQKELEARQTAIVRAIPDMLFTLRGDGMILDAKAGAGRRDAIQPRLFIGRRVADVLPAGLAEQLDDNLRRALADGMLQALVLTLPVDGQDRHYEARLARSSQDQVIAVVRDITREKQNEEKIRRLAYYDPLTGMPNRQHFVERLEQELQRSARERRKLALLFLDLDGFKRINDTLGHDTGDVVLREVALRLKEKLRVSDIVSRPGADEPSPPLHLARLGGDEFVIALPSLEDARAAIQIAQRVRSALTQPFRAEDAEVSIGASIGIAMYPEDGTDAATLLKHADTAMYHAKERGRNNWQMYSEDLTHQAVERLKLENDIRKGLERGEFVLHYQPIVDTADSRIVGVEALLRWQHPERGLLEPSAFIPAAEESGLIIPLGHRALDAACAQGAAWQRAGIAPARIAVNLSGRQLRMPDFTLGLMALLAHHGLDAGRLVLELTEGLVMDGDPVIAAELHRLRAAGVHFALDDFGIGYSSIAHLKRLPIGSLKIDRSFVHGLFDNPNDAGITTAILAMARHLGLDVVAEGVETAAERDFLREAGCRTMQGYLFSPPRPAAEMETLLRDALREPA